VSGENAAIVQRAFDAYQRGDEDAMFALTATDIVVTQFPDQIDVRDYHGHEGLRHVMTEWIGTWEDWSIELLRAREVRGVVLATALQRGRGRASGAPMQTEVAFLFTVRDGLIVRWRMFHSEREALDALELGG
jgi:ketosteroid isomerase-like protein